MPKIARITDDLDELARVIVNGRLTYDDLRPSAALCREAAEQMRALWREVQAIRLLNPLGPVLTLSGDRRATPRPTARQEQER